MPEGNGSGGESRSGEGESNSGNGALWRALKAFFRGSEHDQSLRAQIEEAIDEHEGEPAQHGEIAGDLLPLERQMMKNLLHFSDHDADDVAIPRGQIVAVPANASFADLVSAFAEHGHSRLPVYGESLDEVVGMVHIKDVFPIVADMALQGATAPADWARLMRQPLFVPQARAALDVLGDMRASRTHLAVVIDEYSGTDGIITIEDLVEEIVGEIEDEHDVGDRPMLARLADGAFEADADVTLGEFERESGMVFSDEDRGEVETLGGLVVAAAGQVPIRGQLVRHASGLEFEVLDADPRRIKRLRVRRRPPPQGAKA